VHRPATAQKQAAARGVSVVEYRADPLGTLAASLTARTGQPHSVFTTPAGPAVYSVEMGRALGYEVSTPQQE
jgi:hypothetical protein